MPWVEFALGTAGSTANIPKLWAEAGACVADIVIFKCRLQILSADEISWAGCGPLMGSKVMAFQAERRG